MWTESASPQRPRSTRWPSASCLLAISQIFGATTARGQGRWASTRCPSTRISESGDIIAVSPDLSQNLRDVLEPSDQRRRQVDASDEHQRQMDKHRHIGCRCFGARAARLAKSDTVQPKEKCAEAEQQAEHQ